MAYFQDGKVWDVLNETSETIPAETVIEVRQNVGFTVSAIPPNTIGAVRMVGALEGAKKPGEAWEQNVDLNYDTVNKWFTIEDVGLRTVGLASSPAATDDTVGFVYITPLANYNLVGDALNTFVGAGYGAIFQNTGQTIGTLDATWTQLTLDTARISSPKGVIQNPGNSTLSIQYAGVWQIVVSATLTFTEAQAGRQLGIRLYNVTTDTAGSGSTVFVARNVDGVNISFTILLEISEAETQNEWSVQIAGQNGDTFTTCEVLNANHDLIHVSELAGLILG